MKNVIANKIMSDQFFYDNNRNEPLFHQEASSLPKSFDPTSQIWNDSADAGFVMIGEKTGKELIFFWNSTERTGNDDNEITHWCFIADPKFNKGVIDKPVLATIWND